jgi:hypothetical protein
MIENYQKPLVILPIYVFHTINLTIISQPQPQNEAIFQGLSWTFFQHINLRVNVFQNHHEEDPFDHLDDANIFDHGDTTSTIGV